MTSFEVGTLYDQEDIDAISKVLFSGETLNRGSRVESFEEEFAKYVGAKYAVAVSSCTAALRISYQTLGLSVNKGNVVLQVNSFWNTAVSLLEFGQELRFVDVRKNSLSINVEKIESYIDNETKAIVVTDFGGHPSQYDELMKIAEKYKLPIVADNAHAIGAEYKGRKLGGLATVSCFSFSTLKNISTLGEGGMLTTDDERIYTMARKLRECWPIHFEGGGFKSLMRSSYCRLNDGDKIDAIKKYLRPGDALTSQGLTGTDVIYGSNYKMSAVQAEVGRIQLKKIDFLNNLRANIVQKYKSGIGPEKAVFIDPEMGDQSSWHLCNVLLPQNNLECQLDILEKISKICGLDLPNRYWPLSDHSTVRFIQYRDEKYHNYEELYFGRLISLPVFPTITDDQIQKITSLF